MKEYHNPLKEEMEQYLAFLEKTGRYTRSIAVLFRELDRYIPDKAGKNTALAERLFLGGTRIFHDF